jgi:hypothetical protein
VHIRKMLRDGATAGYIAWPNSQEIRVLPPLHEAVQSFFANAFLFTQHCTNEVFDEIAASRGTGIAQAS